jgi:toxin ParE1/3/4
VKYAIRHHPQADADLLDIWVFIARDNMRAADRLLDRIARKCDLLAEYPELGPARSDIAPGLRMLVVRDYLVLYRIADDGVEIVRVVHGARRLEALL